MTTPHQHRPPYTTGHTLPEGRQHADSVLHQACQTACAELPEDTHPDDMLDAVWQQLPAMSLDDEIAAAAYLRAIR